MILYLPFYKHKSVFFIKTVLHIAMCIQYTNYEIYALLVLVFSDFTASLIITEFTWTK